MDTPKLWRGRTLDDRSADRRAQIVDAGADLLGTSGSAAVTMREVIRRTNLSPRYFYESFDNRDALIIAIYDRSEGELLARLAAAPATADLTATIRAALLICATYFEEDPRRARILLREPMTDDTLRRHSTHRLPLFLRTLVPALGEDAAALIPDSEETLAVIGTALSGALIALYVDWADGRLTLPREHLVDTATTIVLALTERGTHRTSYPCIRGG
ncbi:helix-turn-helix domain-containing protein [Nocardia sp. NPDC024068]|uniref:TetR/AcrR family transcriptional regulator n=1 Tax=Nocardia sp. NPDC024068 TaxID=3157197 RepID=UPI0033D9E601